MWVWSLRWHFTNKSVTGAPYSIKSYSLSHSWTLRWRVRWLKQCRLEVAAELQQYPWIWYQDCCVRDCSSAWLLLHRCWIWMRSTDGALLTALYRRALYWRPAVTNWCHMTFNFAVDLANFCQVDWYFGLLILCKSARRWWRFGAKFVL